MYSDKKGNAAIEFALVSPVIFLIMCGIIEYAMLIFIQIELGSGLVQLSRLGMTGQLNSNVTQGDLKTLLLQQIPNPAFFNANQLTVSSEDFASFSNIGPEQPCNSSPNCIGTFSGGTVGTGGGGNIAIYVATYNWPFITPIMNFLSSSTTYAFSAGVLVKNEPFTSGNR